MKKSILFIALGAVVFNSCKEKDDAKFQSQTKEAKLFVSNSGLNAPDFQAFYNVDSANLTASYSFTDYSKQKASAMAFDSRTRSMLQLYTDQREVLIFDHVDSLTATSEPSRSFKDQSMIDPHGIAFSSSNKGTVFIASSSDSSIFVYEQTDSLRGTITNKQSNRFKLSAQPWGIFYRSSNNTLYVVMDKDAHRVEAFKNPANISIGSTPKADIVYSIAVDSSRMDIARLHGIFYSEQKDVLLLTDIGSEDNASDGAVYMISNFSTITNSVTLTPSYTISGAQTGLGNPVDVSLDAAIEGQNVIYVADNNNNKISVFKSGANGDVAPVKTFSLSYRPEALYLYTRVSTR